MLKKILLAAVLMMPLPALAVADTTPPTLESLQFIPTSADVTTTATVVHVVARVSDDSSGVFSVAVGLEAPYGDKDYTISCEPRISTLIPLKEFVCTTQFLLSPGEQDGDWSVFVYLADHAGNNITLGPDELGASGFQSSFHITSGVTDTSAPELEYLRFFPDTVDVTSSPAIMEAKVRATDSESGVYFVSVGIRSPDNETAYNVSCEPRLYPLLNDTTCLAHFLIPAGEQEGDWSVFVQLQDVAGNTILLESEDLEAAGFPDMVHISS